MYLEDFFPFLFKSAPLLTQLTYNQEYYNKRYMIVRCINGALIGY